MGADWKDTLNLPKTDFPMKANLAQREPKQLDAWRKAGIYTQIQSARRGCPVYSFHDGPPYANGRIHLGHALNKVLKDFIIKSKTMEGYRVTYRPGWDCHGLPIELQIEKEKGRKVREEDIHTFRRHCREYAEKFIAIQREEFIRLGVFGDWENPYRTMDYPYEASIASAFHECFQKGYAYKGMKSVQWCIHCETALAEAEVEYADHRSPTVFVKFPVAAGQEGALPDGLGRPGTSVVIWTTTPWTLPANLAVAFHPEFPYVAIESEGEVLVVAEALAESFLKEIGREGRVVGAFKGARMEGLRLRHPFLDRDSLCIVADYVTSDTGTGCVHTAPGHGQDDYLTGVRYGLPILSPVDRRGRFMADVEHFAGMNVFDANPEVVKLLESRGALLRAGTITHSYPHCWRCKNPLIFRATEQWFISMAHDDLRAKALKAIDAVDWVPAWGRNRIYSMMEGRPDWCLSRQRRWGVPIAVIFCESCGEPVRDGRFFEAVRREISVRGAGVWYEGDAGRFLPPGYACSKCGGKAFRPETDILDVWFDSGVSHRAILGHDLDTPWPSEVYLEGSDQHRGWFHTSLLTALMLKGAPPYKKVITHGFVLDGEGRAMSKSMGNVISPEEALKKHGAEILRLWVSMVDYRDDVRFSWDMLQRNADAYLKIRNTLRYLLGNLFDFTPAEAVAHADLPEMDRYALILLDRVIHRVLKAYREFAFHLVYHELLQFCTVTLSAFYLDVLKDRLYCSAAASPERRSAQTVLYRLADSLVRLMAPILPFTAEEVWSYLPERETPSVHMARFPEASGRGDEALAERWERLRGMREAVNKALEEARQRGEIGKSLEAEVTLRAGTEEEVEFLRRYAGVLPELFIVSSVRLEGAGSHAPAVTVSKAGGEKCARCWTITSAPIRHEESALCPRCALVTGIRA
ncbi:MAG: isoleucine--tRNA ligase [Acidobacteriota bacterium]